MVEDGTRGVGHRATFGEISSVMAGVAWARVLLPAGLAAGCCAPVEHANSDDRAVSRLLVRLAEGAGLTRDEWRFAASSSLADARLVAAREWLRSAAGPEDSLRWWRQASDADKAILARSGAPSPPLVSLANRVFWGRLTLADDLVNRIRIMADQGDPVAECVLLLVPPLAPDRVTSRGDWAEYGRALLAISVGEATARDRLVAAAVGGNEEVIVALWSRPEAWSEVMRRVGTSSPEACEAFCCALAQAIRESLYVPVVPPSIVWEPLGADLHGWHDGNVLRLGACNPGLRVSSVFRRVALNWVAQNGADSLLEACAGKDLGQCGLSVLPMQPNVLESLEITDRVALLEALHQYWRVSGSDGAIVWLARMGVLPERLPADVERVCEVATCAWRENWDTVLQEAMKRDESVVDSLRVLCGVADATAAEIEAWSGLFDVPERDRRRVLASHDGGDWGGLGCLASAWRDRCSVQMLTQFAGCVLVYRFLEYAPVMAREEATSRLVIDAILTAPQRHVPDAAWSTLYRLCDALYDPPAGTTSEFGGLWTWHGVLRTSWKAGDVVWSSTMRRWVIRSHAWRARPRSIARLDS